MDMLLLAIASHPMHLVFINFHRKMIYIGFLIQS